MPDVVGIRFKNCGKIYDFEVNGLEVENGDVVVLESELGLSIGNVVVERHPVGAIRKELKKVLRKATEEDLRQKSENEGLAAEAMAYCIERVMARGLPMKMICTEVTLDRKRFIFYFTADGRIDFRELVKDLAAKFKTRIEMRQIGVRDATKVVGGLGICGREVCCRMFLTSFEPISIRMAKSQELVLNANKLSGVCGRLMCCLGYEYGAMGKPEESDTDSESEVRVENGEERAELFEGPVLPANEELSGPARDRSSGRQTEQGAVYPSPPERAGQRGPEKKGSPVKGETAGHPPAEKTETEGQRRAEAPTGGNEAQGKKFHRRRRHGKRSRK